MTIIIFSLTAHENFECLLDLIINIKKCFVNYEILILLSLTENLYNENLHSFDYVKCVTIRQNKSSIWGNIELFNQHILNIKYIYDNSINYDFFWMVASNEMFIKIIPPDFLDNNSIKIINKKQEIDIINYDIYFKNLMDDNNSSWVWTNVAKKDTHFMNYLYKNKFILHISQHEGIALSSDIVLEIFDEYTRNKLYENSTVKNYPMEEIFLPTFLINRYHLNQFVPFSFIYKYRLPSNSSYKAIKNKMESHNVSIKGVTRNYKDRLRRNIRDNIK